MRESLEQNQEKVAECSEELDAVELSLERSNDKVNITGSIVSWSFIIAIYNSLYVLEKKFEK